MIDTNIKQLVEYGIANELIEEEDRIYTTNTILEMLKSWARNIMTMVCREIYLTYLRTMV